MPQIKQNSTPLVKVRLLSSIDGIQGVTGQSGSTCTLAITRDDGSVNTYAAGAFTLTEVTSGAFANAGFYWLTLPAYGSAILGQAVYCVAVSTGAARIFQGTLEVVANLVSDVMTQLGTPAVSVSADIAAIKSELDTINTSTGASLGSNVTAIKAKTDNLPGDPASQATTASEITAATSPLATASALAAAKVDTAALLKISTGRWKLVSNQLLIYDANNTTVLYTFNLKDAGGSPTMLNPYERVPA